MAQQTRKRLGQARPSRQGKILVVTTDGEVVDGAELHPLDTSPLGHPLGRRGVTKSTSQTTGDHHARNVDKVQERPYPPDKLIELYEHCTALGNCVRQIALDVTAGGWRIVPAEEDTEPNKEEVATAEAFFNAQPWPNTLRRVATQGLVDRGMVGYMAFEVSRNEKDLPDGLYHLPAKTLWVYDRKGERKYLQKIGRKKVWFKEFGDERVLSNKTGLEADDDLPPEERANEVIFCTEPHPKNKYYGLPRGISATSAVFSLLYSRDYNVSFFINHGVPAYIVKLTGDWDPGSETKLKDFLRDVCKGPTKAQETMVMTMPVDTNGKYGDVVIEPVEALETKEGAFRLMRKDDKQEILSAHSMPPYRVGVYEVGKMAGNLGEEASKIYMTSTVHPLEEDLNEMFTRLLTLGFGLTTVKFEWQPADLRDREAEVKRFERLLGMSVVTPGFIADALGYPPPPPEFADVYYVKKNLVPVGMSEGVPENEREQAGAEELLEALREGEKQKEDSEQTRKWLGDEDE